jgi:hypothetical protein
MIEPTKILAGLPVGLRDPLIKHYREIGANFIERRWGPSELDGGKFCETVYSILDGAIASKFPAAPSKPKDMVQACRAFEGLPADSNRVGDRSLRILIPRVLLPLYEIRNNRGVGHVGGDVDPNFLDATAVYGMASWILAELVRIFHGVSTDEAQEAVDALIERKVPLVWEIGEIKRVQYPAMSKCDQALLLLHLTPGWISDKDLANWVGYSSASMFRTRVLEPLHEARLIEYNQGHAHISPLGAKTVFDKLIKARAKLPIEA